MNKSLTTQNGKLKAITYFNQEGKYEGASVIIERTELTIFQRVWITLKDKLNEIC